MKGDFFLDNQSNFKLENGFIFSNILKKEQQYKTIAINEVGVFAYTKKSFWIALPTYYLAMGLMSAASNGAATQPFDFVEPKSFRQNMKVEDGWKAIIFECSKK